MSIIILTPVLNSNLSNPGCGGLEFTNSKIKSLMEISSISIAYLKKENKTINEIPAYIPEFNAMVGVKQRTINTLIQSYVAGLPLSVFRNYSKKAIISRLNISNQAIRAAKILYVDHWLMIPYANSLKKNFPHLKCILNMHNAEHELFNSAYLALKESSRIVDKLQAIAAKFETKRVKSYLKEVFASDLFDEIHFISQSDMQKSYSLVNSQEVADKFKYYLPPATVMDTPLNKDRKSGLFIGSLSWQPTRQGLYWLKSFIDKNEVDNVDFTVIGGSPFEQDKKDLNTNGFNYLGRVDDLDSYYNNAKYFIAPLLSGSGIKIKILNALSRGIPVVTTSVGVEGYPLFDSKENTKEISFLNVANDEKSFMDACSKLNNLSESEWFLFSNQARSYVEKYFNDSFFKEDIKYLLEC